MNKTEAVFTLGKTQVKTQVKTQAKTQAKAAGVTLAFAPWIVVHRIGSIVFGTSVNVALILGYPLLSCLDVQLFRSLTNDATEW